MSDDQPNDPRKEAHPAAEEQHERPEQEAPARRPRPEPGPDAQLGFVELAAGRFGLALENTLLADRIAAEIAAREKRNRELEIAREVQQRLFPQTSRPVAGLDYAGVCRPAFEVGGDYYDFIPISEARFGVAIGDVSGKGVPASLLMATLRAYLHGQTAAGASNLSALMASMNRFVYDSSPANRYATFFYAQYDIATRVLRYVNGGHNPPLLFRAAGSSEDPQRLDKGGPAIGLLPEARYAHADVTLAPGDVLVAFTDGVSEALNAAEEEWGEARLIEAVRAARGCDAEALVERIMAGVTGFVGDAPPYDDMTLVVLAASK